jgi:hypothetical protein
MSKYSKSFWDLRWMSQPKAEKGGPGLFKVDMADKNLNDSSIEAFAEALEHFLDGKKAIAQVMDFSRNNISDAGVHRISAMMEEYGVGVQVIKFYKNRIGDSGANALARMIEYTVEEFCPVEEVHLSHNNMTDAGVSHILDVVIRLNRYPFQRAQKGDICRSPIWIRLEKNYVVNPNEVYGKLKAKQVKFCKAGSWSQCTPRRCCKLPGIAAIHAIVTPSRETQQTARDRTPPRAEAEHPRVSAHESTASSEHGERSSGREAPAPKWLPKAKDEAKVRSYQEANGPMPNFSSPFDANGLARQGVIDDPAVQGMSAPPPPPPPPVSEVFKSASPPPSPEVIRVTKGDLLGADVKVDNTLGASADHQANGVEQRPVQLFLDQEAVARMSATARGIAAAAGGEALSFRNFCRLAEQGRLAAPPHADNFVMVIPEPDFWDPQLTELHARGIVETCVLRDLELPPEEVDRVRTTLGRENDSVMRSLQVGELALRSAESGNRACFVTGSAALWDFWRREASWGPKVPCEAYERLTLALAAALAQPAAPVLGSAMLRVLLPASKAQKRVPPKLKPPVLPPTVKNPAEASEFAEFKDALVWILDAEEVFKKYRKEIPEGEMLLKRLQGGQWCSNLLKKY